MAYGTPIPFTDWRPDGDRRFPGIVLDLDGFMPTERGLRTLPSFRLIEDATLPSASLGAYTATLPNGSHMIVVGTSSHLYKLRGSTWVEFDDDQTFSTSRRWSFTTFGTDIIAANGVDVQLSRSGLPFRPIEDYSVVSLAYPVPKLSYVESVGEGVFGVIASSNEWVFVSPIFGPGGDTYSWIADIATETVYGQLTASPGPITAVHAIRGGIVMYKERSMYFGQFSGPPFYWSFQIISKNIGTPADECVVNSLDQHLFPSRDNFYQFDGASLSPIQNSLAESFFRDTPAAQITRMIGRYTQTTSLAEWYYNSGTARADLTLPLNTALIYNTRVERWSKRTFSDSDGNRIGVTDILSPAFLAGPSLTYREIGELYATYEDIPAGMTYRELCGGGEETQTVGVITDQGQLAIADGASIGGFLLTGEIGDGSMFIQANRARPIFAQWPSDNWSRLYSYFRLANGYPIPDPGPFPLPGVGPVADLTRDGCFCFITTGRALQFRIEVSGQAEITAMALDAVGAGSD